MRHQIHWVCAVTLGWLLISCDVDRGQRVATVAPTFGNGVSPEVQQVIRGFFDAFHRGDGEGAVRYLYEERDRDETAKSLANAPIPVLNAVVTLEPGDQLALHYEIPDLGSILAAVLEGGRSPEAVRTKLQQLVSAPVRDRRAETWRLIRTADGLKIDYRDRGVLRYAMLVGGDVQLYASDDGWRRMSDRVLLEGALPERVPRLMSDYYRSFDIDVGSEDPRPVFDKLRPVLQQITLQDRAPGRQSDKQIEDSGVVLGAGSRGWDALVTANEAMKAQSPLVPKFLRLVELRRKQVVIPNDLIVVAQLPSPLRSAFMHWWQTMEKEGSVKFDRSDPSKSEAGFAAMDAVGQALSDAIRTTARKEDLAFLLDLENLKEVSMWVAGDSSEITQKLLINHLASSRDDVLALLLVAIDHQDAPDTMELICGVVAQSRDARALPTLVDWYRKHPMYSREPVVQAIRQIEPTLEHVKLYFQRAEQDAQKRGFVSAEARHARQLMEELSR